MKCLSFEATFESSIVLQIHTWIAKQFVWVFQNSDVDLPKYSIAKKIKFFDIKNPDLHELCMAFYVSSPQNGTFYIGRMLGMESLALIAIRL